GLCNLHQLLLRHTQARNRPLRVDGSSSAFQQLRCTLTATLPVHPFKEAAGFESQGNVFGNGQVREQRRLLIDSRNTEGSCTSRIVVKNRFSTDDERS